MKVGLGIVPQNKEQPASEKNLFLSKNLHKEMSMSTFVQDSESKYKESKVNDMNADDTDSALYSMESFGMKKKSTKEWNVNKM